jgi:ribulose-5-phosphate 4-epimerase/fuculose-1-phosphate aldolase
MSSLTVRQQLAAACHIAVHHGWDQLIYNHFTCRSGSDLFLAHPFGLLFSEVTASSLLEVKLATGEPVEGSDDRARRLSVSAEVDMPFNKTAYVIHSCIYKARPDVACVLHVHVPCIVAVASCRRGLIVGLSQESALIGPVQYHDYEGIATSLDEQRRIVENLGPSAHVLMLRNHGVVCCGRSVAHALSVLYHVWRACLIQTTLGHADFYLPDAKIVGDAFEVHSNFTKTGNDNLEFDAMVRLLRRNSPQCLFMQ